MAGDFQCKLAHFGIAGILQLLHSERKTGRLLVESESAMLGTVDFCEGNVVAASCGAGRGIVGFLELFVAPAFQVEFHSQVRPSGPPLRDLLALVLEGCQLHDDWARLRDLRPSVVQRPSDARLGSTLGLVAVLAELDGHRTLEDAVARAKVVRASVIEALRELIDSGALAVQAEPPPSPTGSHERYFEGLERGRFHAAEGQYADAWIAFRQALATRPGDPLALQHIDVLRALEAS